MKCRLVVSTLLVVGLGGVLGGCGMGQEEPLETILASHEDLAEVVDQAADYRLQVVLGLVEEGPESTPILRQQEFRAGVEYFYPASTFRQEHCHSQRVGLR